jgi:hypothetical protein
MVSRHRCSPESLGLELGYDYNDVFPNFDLLRHQCSAPGLSQCPGGSSLVQRSRRIPIRRIMATLPRTGRL